MKNVNWDEICFSEPVHLTETEFDQVNGGVIPVAVVAVAVTAAAAAWTAGYTMGKDRAERNNRRGRRK